MVDIDNTRGVDPAEDQGHPSVDPNPPDVWVDWQICTEWQLGTESPLDRPPSSP